MQSNVPDAKAGSESMVSITTNTRVKISMNDKNACRSLAITFFLELNK